MTSGPRPPVDLEDLIVETGRLVEANRVLEERLRRDRIWRIAALTLAAALGLYAWSIQTLLAQNVSLLRANTELVQSGNALLRAAHTRQQEMQAALEQIRRGPIETSRSQAPRRRLEGCAGGSAGCDSPTHWVPGFPGPPVSAKRTELRPSL